MPCLLRRPCDGHEDEIRKMSRAAASTIASAGLALVRCTESQGTLKACAAASALASTSRALPA
jgi:hypothetical protein